jgi:hypothetical protein
MVCAASEVDLRLAWRCAERSTADGGEVGTPPGQSCAWRRPAEAEDGPSQVGADTRASGGAARWAAATEPGDGGLAILSGLRRGELFALRWQDIDREARVLTVREAVYDGTFGTPKPRLDSVRFRCRNRL